MGVEVAKLVAVYEAETGNFERGTAKVNREFNETAQAADRTGASFTGFSKKLESTGQSMSSFGRTLTLGLTTPLVGLGILVLKTGAEYETALNSMQAVTKATSDQMARAGEVAKALGADVTLPGTSAKDAALAMLELGKAGLTVEQSMDAVKGTLQLAKAGTLAEAEAAEITANALNAFNLAATDSVRVSDLLAAAANASSADVTDIAFSLRQASASAAALKIPIEDVTTAIALMANAGIKGSDAGTSLKTFLQSLAAPSKAGADAMEALGISVFDLEGRMKSLPEVINQFSKAFDGATDEEKAKAIQKIFGSDASRAANILFKDGLAGFEELKKAVVVAGAAADLSAAKTKGLAGAWDAFKSQLETIGIELFDSVKEPLTLVLKQATEVAGVIGQAFENAGPGIQIATIALLGLAAAIGPVLIVLGSIVSAIGTVAGALPTIGVVAAAIVGLGIQMAPLIAVAAAWYAAWKTNFGGIQELVGIVVGKIQAHFEDMRQKVGALVGQLVAEIAYFWDQNGEDILKAVQKVSDNIKTVWGAIIKWWDDNGETIKSVTTAAWEVVKSVVVGAARVVMNAIKLVAAIINGEWGDAWEATKGILSSIVDAWKGILSGAGSVLLGAVKLAFNAIWAYESTFYRLAWEMGKMVIQGIIDGMKSLAPRLVGVVTGIMNRDVIGLSNSILGTQSPSRVFHDIGGDVVQGFVNGLEAGGPKVRKAMANVIDIPGLKKAVAQQTKELTKSLAEITMGNRVDATPGIIALQFKILDAEKTQNTISELIRLRHELQINMDKPLVAGAAAEAEVRTLTAMKDAVGAMVADVKDLMKSRDPLGDVIKLFANPNLAKELEKQAAALGITVNSMRILAKLANEPDLTDSLKKIAGGPAEGFGVDRTGTGATPFGFDPEKDTPIGAEPPPAAPWTSFFGMVQAGFMRMREVSVSWKEHFSGSLFAGLASIGDVLADSVREWDGTLSGFFQSVASGFLRMGQTIVSELMRIAAQKLVFQLISSLVGSVVGGFSGGGLFGMGSSNSLTGAGSAFANFGSGFRPVGFAEGGWVPRRSGGTMARIGEGGYDEVVLSTNPAYRSRSAGLMNEFAARTDMGPNWADRDPEMVVEGGGTTINNFNFHPTKDGRYPRESAEQAVKVMINGQNRYARKTSNRS